MGATQVNSQSQSGAAGFYGPSRQAADPDVSQASDKKWKIQQIAGAEAEVKKKVKVHAHARKKSNAQGQGQITQADLVIQDPDPLNQLNEFYP